MKQKVTNICKRTTFIVSDRAIISVVIPTAFFKLSPHDKDQVIDAISSIVFHDDITFELPEV